MHERYVGVLVGVVVAVSIVAATGVAGAAPADGLTDADDERPIFVDDLDDLVETHNGQVGHLRADIRDRYADEPTKRAVALNGHDLLMDRLAGERIEVNVRREDGGVQKYHVRMNDSGHVVEHHRGADTGQPTMDVTTEEETVRTMTDTETPTDGALEAFGLLP